MKLCACVSGFSISQGEWIGLLGFRRLAVQRLSEMWGQKPTGSGLQGTGISRPTAYPTEGQRGKATAALHTSHNWAALASGSQEHRESNGALRNKPQL